MRIRSIATPLLAAKNTIVGFVAVALSLGALTVPSSVASADVCSVNGRLCGYGYFYNGGPVASGHNLYGPAPGPGLQANNLSDLLGMLGSRMSCGTVGKPNSALGFPQSDQNASSAAYTILTMLGAPPGTAKNQACVRYLEWVDLVTSYDKAGLIHYNESHNSGGLNTLFSDTIGGDVVWYADSIQSASIVFYDPNGSGPLYAIKRDCGNPIGDINMLPPIKPAPPPPPVQPPTGDINPPTL